MREATGRVLDEYLVVAAAAGDRRAFGDLARRWNRKLIAHAWRLTGDQEIALEAAQSAWVEIARGIVRLRDEKAFPAWAYRIVSRRCARLIAARQADRALAASVAAEPPPPPAMTDDAFGMRLEAERLHAAIRALPPAQRAAIALFHFEQMTVAETAVALDIPAGTVKTRLMHARLALRAVLEGDDHA
ncbi:RNA polymerase sigma factor [Brevundimonas sp.]|uniref:RNA polymerase sigma factor n=1 Tax=Brevundimonas sp. TaxID=1871086 RepID=UPI004034DADD